MVERGKIGCTPFYSSNDRARGVHHVIIWEFVFHEKDTVIITFRFRSYNWSKKG